MRFDGLRLDAPVMGLVLVGALLVGCFGCFALALSLSTQTISQGEGGILSMSETLRRMENEALAKEQRRALSREAAVTEAMHPESLSESAAAR
jgi:hypothetical protein